MTADAGGYSGNVKPALVKLNVGHFLPGEVRQSQLKLPETEKKRPMPPGIISRPWNYKVPLGLFSPQINTVTYMLQNLYKTCFVNGLETLSSDWSGIFTFSNSRSESKTAPNHSFILIKACSNLCRLNMIITTFFFLLPLSLNQIQSKQGTNRRLHML